jgi:hypothetical protein
MFIAKFPGNGFVMARDADQAKQARMRRKIEPRYATPEVKIGDRKLGFLSSYERTLIA